MAADQADFSDALHGRFLRGLARNPEGTAARYGEQRVRYTELHGRALAWAGALLDATPQRPLTLGILTAGGITGWTAVLAGLYAGAPVVPLNPAFPPERLRRMVTAAGVTALVTDTLGDAVLPALLQALPDRPRLPVLAAEASGGAGPAAGPAVRPNPGSALDRPRAVSPQDRAYILFTSGSTGTPKAVPVTHGNTAHYFRTLDARYDFAPDDVFSQTFDLGFDCAMFDLFCAWGAGGTLLGVPERAYHDLPAFAARNSLSVWFSTPAAIAVVRRAGGLTPDVLPGLRWSLFIGEAFRRRDAADWQRAAPASAVENLYGPTELTISISAHRYQQDRSPALSVNGVLPIGAVHDGHEHLLLDADGEPVSDEGELCVTGPQTVTGYLDPEQDRGRFLVRDGRTWYRTGDRVRRVEGGELVCLGRGDAQVQVRGWRVEPAEIDHALADCDGVEETLTVGVRSAGTDELVTFHTGAPLPVATLARHLLRTVPVELVPRRFQHLAEMPLNTNRKIDRAALISRAERLVGLPAADPAPNTKPGADPGDRTPAVPDAGSFPANHKEP
ncbi:AMP-binding protein [Streptomyces sp. NPDC088732]|uniref:AMP-binding protein n=1 Tax=Streptomyces sp. NPDC088732 TaxID=3365879 RepID=UPI0038080903